MPDLRKHDAPARASYTKHLNAYDLSLSNVPTIVHAKYSHTGNYHLIEIQRTFPSRHVDNLHLGRQPLSVTRRLHIGWRLHQYMRKGCQPPGAMVTRRSWMLKLMHRFKMARTTDLAAMRFATRHTMRCISGSNRGRHRQRQAHV